MEKIDEKDGVWRTVNGQHIFIKDGEDISTAMARHNMNKGMKERGREGIAREIDKRNEEEEDEKPYTELEYKGRKIKIYREPKDPPADPRIIAHGLQQARTEEDRKMWEREKERYERIRGRRIPYSNEI